MEISEAYKEKVRYDSLEKPTYIKESQLSDLPNKTFPCHWHDEVEFLYVYSGKVTYHVDGELYRLQAGEGIFVNSQHIHYGFSEDGSDAFYLCVILPTLLLCATPYIEANFVTPVMNNEGFPVALLRPDTPWTRDILRLLLEIDRVYQSEDPSGMLEIQSCYCKIWRLLYLNQPKNRKADRRERVGIGTLKQMLEYIYQHYGEKIKLSDIAEAGNVCESSCCRLFRKYLDRTPVECVVDHRLSEACSLLRETSLSMTEIANRTGFTGPSYFAEMFRKHYGCSPSSFKRQCKEP